MTATCLAGRVAIVTGGAGGIGSEVCHVLAAAGASVVVADIDASGAEAVAAALPPGSGVAFAGDVATPGDARAMVEAAVATFGAIDVLVNNAALVSSKWARGDLDPVRVDPELWDETMAVNVRGPFLVCKYAIPYMTKAEGGSIVNVSSVVSLAGDRLRTAYTCSKAALNALTRQIATSYGRQGVRCNVVLPGAIVTRNFLRGGPDATRAFEATTALPRLGTPADVAAAVLFLASDSAAFVTGQELRVDGGLLSHVPWWIRPQVVAEASATT
jgi:NAD(P)-dependent dehydrogenase (short-subunit alcohol dehydrogenase family)